MSEKYTYEEVSKHNTPDDLWMVINGKVVDVSKYVDDHPGGDEVLLEMAGQDATEAFEDVGHSESAFSTMESYVIGVLDDSSSSNESAVSDIPKFEPATEENEENEIKVPVPETEAKVPSVPTLVLEQDEPTVSSEESPAEESPVEPEDQQGNAPDSSEKKKERKSRRSSSKSSTSQVETQTSSFPWGLAAVSIVAVALITTTVWSLRKRE